MEKKARGLLGLILLIISIALCFVNTFAALIFAILAFIEAVTTKNKRGIVWVTLIGSIIVLCVQVILIVIAYQTISKEHDKVNDMSYAIQERQFRNSAMTYVDLEILKGNLDVSKQQVFVVSLDEVMEIDGCDGYAIYDYNSKEIQAYLKCEKYTSPGFDESKLK